MTQRLFKISSVSVLIMIAPISRRNLGDGKPNFTFIAFLSDCIKVALETGLGDELINGQGVYGLQRAFLTAGAKSVLMSLWVVDDNATKELMTNFYGEWIKNYSSSNKRSSFRKAQLEVKKRYPSPYYWGAFVMIGK